MDIINYIEKNLLLCPYKKHFGIDCFGCGMQRSALALLKGEIVGSFYLYPPLFPMIFMLLFLVTHLVFKLKNGATFLKYNFIFVVFIVVINFVVKLILN